MEQRSHSKLAIWLSGIGNKHRQASVVGIVEKNWNRWKMLDYTLKSSNSLLKNTQDKSKAQALSPYESIEMNDVIVFLWIWHWLNNNNGIWYTYNAYGPDLQHHYQKWGFKWVWKAQNIFFVVMCEIVERQ